MPELLRLRELVMDDASALLEIYSDKKAMKYRGSKPMESIEDALDFTRNKSVKKDEILTIRKGVELLETSKLIGSVMFRWNVENSDRCEIGYSIGRKYWGQGYGYQIVSIMVKELSKNDEINFITAWSNKENLASIRILEKLGFQKVEQNNYQEQTFYEKQLKKLDCKIMETIL